MKTNDGGSAFPIAQQYDPAMNVVVSERPGMSLRDYFASNAIAPLFDLPLSQSAAHRAEVLRHAASYAWEVADALLATRGGQPVTEA